MNVDDRYWNTYSGHKFGLHLKERIALISKLKQSQKHNFINNFSEGQKIMKNNHFDLNIGLMPMLSQK